MKKPCLLKRNKHLASGSAEAEEWAASISVVLLGMKTHMEQHCLGSRASAPLHQPKETQSATFTHGDLINRHPADFSKSSTLTPSITKLFWWKWLKLTIIISFRDAPRGFGKAQTSLFTEHNAKKSLSWRAHPPQRQGNQGIAERKERRQKILAQDQKADPWQSYNKTHLLWSTHEAMLTLQY